MKREEAVALIKEINDKCPAMDGINILIVPPNADNVLSKGYQLQIKTDITEEVQDCIEAILSKYNLTMSQEENLLVIYRHMEK